MMNGQEAMVWIGVLLGLGAVIYMIVSLFTKSHYQDYQEGFETSKDWIFPLVGIGAAALIGGGYFVYTMFIKK